MSIHLTTQLEASVSLLLLLLLLLLEVEGGEVDSRDVVAHLGEAELSRMRKRDVKDAVAKTFPAVCFMSQGKTDLKVAVILALIQDEGHEVDLREEQKQSKSRYQFCFKENP